MAFLPTPTKCGNYNRKGASAASGDGIGTVLRRRYLPTTRAKTGGPERTKVQSPGHTGANLEIVLRGYLPTTRHSDAARGGRGDLIQALSGNPNKHYLPTASATEYGSNRGGAGGRVGPKRPSLRGHLGGSPNPDWLDWYVGLPIGWSGLQPLGTYRFRQWLEQHGSC